MPPASQAVSQPAPQAWRKRKWKRNLKAVHRQAIRMFMAGATPPEVAAELGVARWTAWRWLEGRYVGAIRAALDEVRDERVARAEWASDPAVRAAIGTLEATINDDRVPHHTRVVTALRMLDSLTVRNLGHRAKKTKKTKEW